MVCIADPFQWSTTWQRDNLFTYKNLGSSPIDFVTPGSTGTSDIKVDDTAYYQDIVGFGAALSKQQPYSTSTNGFLTMAFLADSSAKLLNQLKVGCRLLLCVYDV